MNRSESHRRQSLHDLLQGENRPDSTLGSRQPVRTSERGINHAGSGIVYSGNEDLQFQLLYLSHAVSLRQIERVLLRMLILCKTSQCGCSWKSEGHWRGTCRVTLDPPLPGGKSRGRSVARSIYWCKLSFSIITFKYFLNYPGPKNTHYSRLYHKMPFKTRVV